MIEASELLNRIENLSQRIGEMHAEKRQLQDKLWAAQQSPSCTPEQVIELLKDMAAGRNIEAIKRLRNMVGLGLKESKDLIEGARR